MISKNERVLAGFVFVLWTLGVVLLPVVAALPWLFNLLLALYAALHVAAFVFACYALAARVRQRHRGWKWLAQATLYVYAVVMLCISFYFLWSTLTMF